MTPPNIVWAFDFTADGVRPLQDDDVRDALASEPQTLRWLHLNLTDQASGRWIEAEDRLPAPVRELLQSADTHPRALVCDGYVACVLQDFEIDFGKDDMSRFGALRFALGGGRMITARHHPVCAADVIRRRIASGAHPQTSAKALDLLVTSLVEAASTSAVTLNATVQSSEDALLADGWEPDPRALVAVRRKTVQLHRQLFGLRGVLLRLEEDDDLPGDLLATVEKLSQRVAALDGDVQVIQADLRLLREELDLQAAHRTNQNLYVLSILSALLLPATLVTGFFGMNTGGFPWAQSPYGTFFATMVAVGSACAVYVWLRRQGFLGGK